MIKDLAYPESFPNESEERFLRLVLASDTELVSLWEAWKRAVDFDAVDSATLGLLPLLYLRLSALQRTDEMLPRIRGVYKMVWVKNQRLLEAVREVVEQCTNESIPVIALKGIALLERVYANPGARFLGDGDILIRSEDAMRVFSIMTAHGWRPVDRTIDLKNPAAVAALNTVTHALPFVDGRGREIEVHWRVFHLDTSKNLLNLLLLRSEESTTEINAYWQRALPVTIKGAPCHMLSFEDLLIHIVVHGAEGNTYRPIRWVADAVYLIRSQSIDWNRVAAYAIAGNHTIAVGVGVHYLAERFAIAVPESFFAALDAAPSSPDRIVRYYRTARGVLSPLGNFPLLWYRYWKIATTGPFLTRFWSFPDYLAKAWGLHGKGSIPSFIFNKYRVRFTRWFGR